MISKLIVCAIASYLVSRSSALSSFTAQSATSIKKNQQMSRILLGKNKRPMKGSSADFKSQPMEWRQAIRFLDETLSTGFIPDVQTWTTVLRICQKSREAIAALSVFNRMKVSGVEPDRFAYQVAISSCLHLECTTDSWQRAVALFKECDKILPLTGTGGIMDGKLAMSIFSVVISACERAAQGRVAIDLYDLMSQRVNLPRPDLVTVSSIVAACEVESDWTKLETVLTSSKVVPDLILYHQLIRIAGKRNDPREAFNHLRAAVKQGLRPTRGTYRELVEACRQSADRVPNGAYLLEQAKLLLNKAFSSCIANDADGGPVADFQLNGETLSVSNGPGGRYEQATRKMLNVLSVTTDFRLHDHSALPESGSRVPVQAAQEILAMHCEKQALAALLEDQGDHEKLNGTIRLAVSLCMCSDCHMVFKYASQAYGRRIECHDPSRKHCFENGSCSCLDNWPGKNRVTSIGTPVNILTFAPDDARKSSDVSYTSSRE